MTIRNAERPQPPLQRLHRRAGDDRLSVDERRHVTTAAVQKTGYGLHEDSRSSRPSRLRILDYVGRLVADVVKVGYLAGSSRWSESIVYSVVVWGLITFGTIILLSGFDQPIVLLVISAVLGGFMMFVYSMLLIRTNRRSLPQSIQLGGYRLALMVFIVAFFGFFSALTIGDQWGELFG
jgi:hypothetical protein